LLEGNGTLINNFTFWFPNKCKTHHYTKSELVTCLRERAAREGKRQFIIIIGDSMGRYLSQTIFQETNLTTILTPYIGRLDPFASMSSDYLKVEYVRSKFLSTDKAIAAFLKKPTLTLFDLGRWYLFDNLWHKPGTNLTMRLKILDDELKRLGRVTTAFLRASPRSKVNQLKLLI
jgi:hypothetical protein